MKRNELEASIKIIEKKINVYKEDLQKMREQLKALDEQEKERKKFVSSKELIDLIYKKVGKKINMSTIKRWADEGYLGEVIDEKEKFWALHSKQGKKRFLYPKVHAFTFLYEKGYLLPEFEVLDRVLINNTAFESVVGIVIDSSINKGEFQYSIQIEETYEVIKNIKESELTQVTRGVNE